MFRHSYGIIVACDVKTVEDLKVLVEATTDLNGVEGYKLGFILALRFGLPNVVEVVKDMTDLPVIYDYQKAGSDIPEMGSQFAAIMKEAQVGSAIIFPHAGPDTQKAFIEALQKDNIVPMVGGEMTHPRFLEKDGGYLKNDAPERIYKLGASLGVKFFVVPGNKPEAISKYGSLLPNGKFCMPGIGAQGGSLTKAFDACPNEAYAIIGSAIYKAPDMREAAKKFCNEVEKYA